MSTAPDAVTMALSLAQLIAGASGSLPLPIAPLVVLLPWVAACTRRLRDTGSTRGGS